MTKIDTSRNIVLPNWAVLFLVTGLIILMWLFGPFLAYKFAPSISTDEKLLPHLGLMGDSYGGLNAFFTGLSLIGVVAALILQTRELRSQVKASEDQADTLRKQLDLTRRASQFSAYSQVVDEYTKAEVKDDVRNLWQFYREEANGNPRELERVFQKHLDAEAELDRSNLSDDELFNLVSTSQDQRRKRVVNFYHKIKTYIDLNMLDEELFYLGWGENDLRIIPEILFPMQRVVAASSGKPKPAFDELDTMPLYTNRFPKEAQTQRLIWETTEPDTHTAG